MVDFASNPALVLAEICDQMGIPLDEEFVAKMVAFCDEPVTFQPATYPPTDTGETQ